MTKIISTIICFVILSNYAYSQFSGGTGTEADPYQITSRADMEALADSVNNGNNWSKGKYFRLMNDITDSVRTPIGRIPFHTWDFTPTFQGHFNGGGNKITISLRHDKLTFASEWLVGGLFNVMLDATIDSLDVYGLYVADQDHIHYVGGLVGWCYGDISITHCNNYVEFEDVYEEMWDPYNGTWYVRSIGALGGIVGKYDGEWPLGRGSINIGYCNNYSNMRVSYMSGIITTVIGNANSKSRIHNCNNYGNFEGDDDTTKQRGARAGIVGEVRNTIIDSCNNYGNLTGHIWGGNFAGIVGRLGYHAFDSTNIITNCNNYGILRHDYERGGGSCAGIAVEVGRNSYVSDCKNYGEIIARYGASGVIGSFGDYIAGDTVNYTELKNLVNYGNVTSLNGAAAGIMLRAVGFPEFSLSNCKNFGNISGKNNVGGIMSSVIEHVPAEIKNCFNAGTVTGENNTSGILGKIGSPKVTVENCINIGTVRGHTNTGGIVSIIDTSTYMERHHTCIGTGILSQNINSGLIIGRDGTGGIVGRITAESADSEIRNCLNTGVVISNFRAGGIAGEVANTTIENCYYDKQMCVYGGIDNIDVTGQAEGFLTNELLGNNLLAKLGTANWSYSNDLYPTLKFFENDTVAFVGASPIYLCAEDIDSYDTHNDIRHHFKVSPANNVVWASAFSNVNISGDGATIISLGNDTLFAGIGVYRKTIPVNFMDNRKCANFPPEVKIWVDVHKLVDPLATNYQIPIYISSDSDISGFTIDTLIIAIDRKIFYLQRVDNGVIASYGDGLILLRNIKIPTLTPNTETTLVNLFGAILLYSDSSDILLKEVKFVEDLPAVTELIDGYITLDICEDRLFDFFDYSPSVTVKNNPVTALLELECKVIERGFHRLDIVDLQGKVATVAKWTVADAKEQGTFNFEIPVINYGNGSYLIILHTPTQKFSAKFIIQK